MEREHARLAAEVFCDFLDRVTKARKVSRKQVIQDIARGVSALAPVLPLRYRRGRKALTPEEVAEFWEHAESKRQMEDWLVRQGDKITEDDSIKFFEFHQQFPGRLRNALDQAKIRLTPLSGGNPSALSPVEIIQARRRVQELVGQGNSHSKAWKIIAREMKVSEHTIRRACDPKEAQRSGYAKKQKGLLIVEV